MMKLIIFCCTLLLLVTSCNNEQAEIREQLKKDYKVAEEQRRANEIKKWETRDRELIIFVMGNLDSVRHIGWAHGKRKDGNTYLTPTADSLIGVVINHIMTKNNYGYDDLTILPEGISDQTDTIETEFVMIPSCLRDSAAVEVLQNDPRYSMRRSNGPLNSEQFEQTYTKAAKIVGTMEGSRGGYYISTYDNKDTLQFYNTGRIELAESDSLWLRNVWYEHNTKSFLELEENHLRLHAQKSPEKCYLSFLGYVHIARLLYNGTIKHGAIICTMDELDEMNWGMLLWQSKLCEQFGLRFYPG